MNYTISIGTKESSNPKQMIESNQKKASTTTALKDSGTVFDSITPIPTPNEHSAIDLISICSIRN
jgi:hypothetical protein